MVVKTTTTTTRGQPRRVVVNRTVVQTSNGKARRRRNNRRNRLNRATMPASLNAGSGSSGQQYLKCLLADSGAAKIPDGSTKRTVAIEYKVAQTLQPAPSGQLVVACLPGLPGSLRVLRGASTAMTDRTGQTQAVTSVNGLQNKGLTIPFPEWYGQLDPATFSDQEYNSDLRVLNARTVKYSMEVMQVGPVLNQQGNAVTVRMSNIVGPEYHYPQLIDMTAANDVVQPNTYSLLKSLQPFRTISKVDSILFSTMSTLPGSKMCSATEPCYLLGKGCGEFIPVNFPYPWRSNYTSPASFGDTVIFTAEPTYAGSAGSGAWYGLTGSPMIPLLPVADTAAIKDTFLVGDVWTDSESEILIWAGENLGTTSTFEVRVTLCLEMEVDYVSSDYRPFVTPAPPADYNVIEKADEIMKLMPPSVSKTGGGAQSWWNVITTGVTGVADIVAGLGLPVATPIAGAVSRIAKMLGGLAA